VISDIIQDEVDMGAHKHAMSSCFPCFKMFPFIGIVYVLVMHPVAESGKQIN
jgi:hypothetical protein